MNHGLIHCREKYEHRLETAIDLREHPKGGVPAEQDYLRSAGGGLVRPYQPIQRPLSISCRIGDPQTRARPGGRPPCNNHPPVINGNTISR